jgi:RHS repeat-associated protein
VNITDASHVIELDWQAATAAGANNGKVDWWLDGTQQTGVSGIDNDTRRIDRARLGLVAGLDTTTTGAHYFDAFESRRQTYIGSGTALPEALFANDFESGNLSYWTSNTGTPTVSTAASLAPVGTQGMAITLASATTAKYVTDDTPTSEKRYRARFYFDPNTITMANSTAHYIFYGYTGTSTVVLRVEFSYLTASGYRLRVAMSNDSTTFTNSNWVNITDAAHVIELGWQASTAAGANNGKVDWWIDGTQQTGVSGVDNDTRRIDRVRLGAVSGVDATTNGTTYFDAFESRRSTYIGPLGGGTVTTTITFAYDALYRVKDVVYSTGDEFHYQYDAVGNALSYTRTVSGLTVTTTYTYNEANQLLTAQASNDPTVWHYLYDANGSLTDLIPNGTTPTNGARRYTYDAAGRLTQAELHDGVSYQPQADMVYDGLGHRLSMTGWQGGLSATTTYALDLTTPTGDLLSATSSSNTTFYLYAQGRPLAELTAAWAYYLNDATQTPRQLIDATGNVTLVRTYTPWGEVLSQSGTGNFTWGYFGGLMDAATGLLYVGGGQYYDPATGRFLTRLANPDATNPYVPRGGDPLGAVLAPFALLALLGGRRKRGKHDKLILMLMLMVAVGGGLVGCEQPPGPPPTNTSAPPTLPPPNVSTNVPPTQRPPTATPSGKTAYLTFDDGPDPQAFTIEIAAVLNTKGIKATFFLTGADKNGLGEGQDFVRLALLCQDYVQGRSIPGVNANALQAQALLNLGHAIGLHGWYHVNWKSQSDSGFSQLTLEEDKLQDLGINLSEPVMVRTPELEWGTVPIPNYKPARYYDADVISEDNRGISAKAIVDTVVSQLASKNYPDRPIILLHSTPAVNTYQTLVNPTPDADLIANLQAIGYTRFEALPRPGDPLDTVIGTHYTGG